MMCFHVKFRLLILYSLFGLKNRGKQFVYPLINLPFRDFSPLHGTNKDSCRVQSGIRHFQIGSGLHPCSVVVGAAPVRNDNARKFPVSS